MNEQESPNPVRVVRIETTAARAIARAFVNEHHSYIRWADRPSRKLYWMIQQGDDVLGVWGLASAFAHPGAVKQYMQAHGLTFNQIANNVVYALKPHGDKNLGSRAMSLLREDAVLWWKERYGDDLRAFQTFILPPRTGAIYRADNWECLGTTSGGTSMSTRTLYGEDRNHPKAVKTVMKGGEVKYLLREHRQTEKKLIFMRMSSLRRRRAAV